MNRTVNTLMTDWEYSSGDSPAPAGGGQVIDLPHDWAIHRPIVHPMEWGVDQAFRDWRGIGWYRKSLHMEHVEPGRRYLLDFDGVYENATVTVNGIAVGGQAYGYSPFRLDMTDALHPGDNDILVRVENLDTPTDRWYSGAGIYRTVRMFDVPERHLDERDVAVRQAVDCEARTAVLTIDSGVAAGGGAASGTAGPGDAVSSEADSRASTGADRVIARLVDADGTTVAEGDGTSDVTLQVADITLWSADTPYLYTLTLELVDAGGDRLDAIDMRIGLRDVRFDPDRGMLVNGAKVIFRGVCLHQDLGCVGSASTKELMRDRLRQLKDMGCNGLRLAHHAHPCEMLDLADEMGFYVYAEPFDKWTAGHYGRYFDTGLRHDLAAMMRRDRNRPSVVMWGVGNEVENQAKRSMLATLRTLVDWAHELDPTRPVGCAMSPHFQSEAADIRGTDGILQATDETSADQEIDDPAERVERIRLIADITDVTVVNYSEQWYDRIHAAIPDKPIFGSEVYQWFMGHDRQMQDYRSVNPNLVPEGKPYVIGGAIWAGFDYLGESMGWPSKGWSGALIRTNGVPKAGYWLLRSYWRRDDEPFVHFMVADYSQPDENVKEHWDIPPFVGHWHFPQFRRCVVPYMIATNCDEVRIHLPQRELYVKPVDRFENRVVTGYLPYQPGELTVVGYRGGREVCRETTVTPVSPAVRLQFADMTERMPLPETMVLPARRGYMRLLTVRCLDLEDNPVFRESAPVRFVVDGPADIVAVDNGDLMGNEPYDGDTIHMHQGVASVMVRLVGDPGHVVVRAAAPGMRETTQVLVVE